MFVDDDDDVDDGDGNNPPRPPKNTSHITAELPRPHRASLFSFVAPVCNFATILDTDHDSVAHVTAWSLMRRRLASGPACAHRCRIIWFSSSTEAVQQSSRSVYQH